jgi:hypothetical protein
MRSYTLTMKSLRLRRISVSHQSFAIWKIGLGQKHLLYCSVRRLSSAIWNPITWEPVRPDGKALLGAT